MTTERANRAKRLLNHYLRMAVEGSGQRCWDSDNTAEVDDIVDSIVEASAPAAPAPQPTAATVDQPDMIAQAGALLKMLQQGDSISTRGFPDEDDRAIVIASTVLAVAGELRELRNVLADGVLEHAINTMPDALDFCEWRQADEYWTASCGLAWFIEEGNPADNGMKYCPQCGQSLIVATEDGAS